MDCIREPEFIEMGMDIRVNLYRDQDADKTPISADKSLSVNENKVIEYLQSNQAITNRAVQELCGIKDTASKNLLRKMVEKELLDAVGEKKAREYRLKQLTIDYFNRDEKIIR